MAAHLGGPANDDYRYLFKFIIIGDEAVGKTCVLLQFTDQRYRDYHEVTVGVEFGTKTLQVEGTNCKLQIWDTAGQDRFRSIVRSYYRGAAAALLVYDITRRVTFENCEQWLQEAKDNAQCDLVVTLVGNKSDLEDKRQVSYEEGHALADKMGISFIETSAYSGENIEACFYETAKMSLQPWKEHNGDIPAAEEPTRDETETPPQRGFGHDQAPDRPQRRELPPPPPQLSEHEVRRDQGYNPETGRDRAAELPRIRGYESHPNYQGPQPTHLTGTRRERRQAGTENQNVVRLDTQNSLCGNDYLVPPGAHNSSRSHRRRLRGHDDHDVGEDHWECGDACTIM